MAWASVNTASKKRRSGRNLVLVKAAALAVVVGSQPLGAATYTLNADGPAGGGASTINWNNPASWTGGPAGTFPGTDPADIAIVNFREAGGTDGTGDAAPTVDLGGQTYTIASLTFSETAAGNADGNFTNGTLNLASLTYAAGGGREIDFETSMTLNGTGPGNSLAVTSSGNNIDMLGAITPTTALSYTSTTQFFRLNRAIGTTSQNAGLASLTQGAGAAFVIQNFDTSTAGVTAGLQAFTVGSLIVNNNGKLELDRAAGTAAFSLDVTGTTTINPLAGGARLRLDANDADAVLNLNGLVTIDNDGNGVEIGSEDQRSVININGGIADGGQNDVLSFVLQGTIGGNGTFGSVNINGVASARTAETNITGGRLNLNVNNGLGTGRTNVRASGFLNMTAAQSAPNISVDAYGAIGGDLTNATYGVGGNVVLPAANAVIVAGTTNVPTTAVTGGAVHFLGVNANTGTFVVGDDGDAGTTSDIYKSVAFGTYSPIGSFAGTVTPANATADLDVYMQAGKQFGAGGTATFNTSGAINFFGPGLVQFNEPDATGITRAIATLAASGADVFNRIGDVTTQNITTVRFSDVSSFVAGQTISVTHGRVDLDNAGAVEAGATVNVGAGATLSLDLAPTTGTFNINQSAALAVTGLNVNAGATFNLNATNGLLILDGDMTIPAGTTMTTLMSQMDLVLHDADADDFKGTGLILGQGKRLTTGATQSADLTGGVGVTAAAGVNHVIFSAASGDTLDINDAVNLAGVDLQINDTTGFTTIVSGGTGSTNFARQVLEVQNGTVALNTSASRSIDVQAGTLRFEQGAVAGLKDGSITTASGGLGGLTRIRSGGAVEIEYNQETAAAGIFIDEVFLVEGTTPQPAGRTFILDRNGTVTGGNNIITLNNVRMVDGAFVSVDVQDTSSTQGRLSLRLMGTATTVQRTSTTPLQDDFSLGDVTGIDPDGTLNAIAPRTLNIGVTPAGTSPGSGATPNSGDFILVNTIFGTVASNVNINVINAQVNFESGSVLNGTINANTRTGDFFIRILGGQEGTPANRVTGTGVINLGHDVGTVVEDLAGFVNEVDVTTVTTPIYNRSDLRVNILNRTSIGGGNRAVLRADRGVDITNAAVDLPGTFEFGTVHAEAGTIATLESSNEQRVITNFNLDHDLIVESNNGSNAFIRNVTDPGSPSSLIVRGTNAVRAIGNITASRVVIGGSLASNAGTLVLQPHDATFEAISSVNYPRLAGPASSAVMNLTQGIEVGQGGNLDVGDSGGSNGSFSITSGLSVAGNGDVDVYVPMTIPAGKRLTGSSSSPISITLAGSLTVAGGGVVAPGASPGTLSIAGNLALASGAIYEYEIGATPATSDLIDLTGTSSTVSFGSTIDLSISNPGGADVAGQTYVLINYTGADPASLPAINFTGPLSGDVQIDSANSQIILTNVVPEPGSIALAAMAGMGLLMRRRRR